MLYEQEKETTRNQTTSTGDTILLKVALPLSEKFNRNNSRQRKKKCRNLVKVNHPEQEKAFEPTREIETSSQVHCLSADFLLLRR